MYKRNSGSRPVRSSRGGGFRGGAKRPQRGNYIDPTKFVSKAVGPIKEELLIVKVKDAVSRGTKLAESLGETNYFPPMAVNMIGVGEEGGDLGNMLEKIAELYDRDVNNLAAGLLSLLEPMIIIVLGVVIGSIVISLFLPILKMHQLVSH